MSSCSGKASTAERYLGGRAPRLLCGAAAAASLARPDTSSLVSAPRAADFPASACCLSISLRVSVSFCLFLPLSSARLFPSLFSPVSHPLPYL